MKKHIGPIQGYERINSIDTIRGFAIHGIFLTNMIDFHSPMLYLNPFLWWSSSTDQTFYHIIDFFVQASFYPLFALLFGFGLMIIKERTMDRGQSFAQIAIRRLSFLLVIGLIHAFLIWHGDILINYAVFGLIAIMFFRLSGKGLLFTGFLSYIIPNILMGVLLFLTTLGSPNEDISNHDEAIRAVNVYQKGSYLEITFQRIYDWSQVNNVENLIFLFFIIFPFLLIGAGIAKLNWIKNEIDNKKRLKVLLLIFALTGSLLKLLPFAVRNLFSEYVQDIFGGPLLAVTYALLIMLLFEKYSIRFNIFQAVGRLALSNYLFQSIVSTFLFYGYGLGLYNKISIGTGIMLAAVIFTLQALLSILWVKKYQHGPIEWIWRRFTYGNK